MTTPAHDVIVKKPAKPAASEVRLSNAFDMVGALSWYQAAFVEYILPPAYADLHRQVTAEVARIAPSGRILDVGCGAAHAAIRLAEQCPQAKIVGVDLSRHMLSFGKRHLQERRVGNVSLHFGDATDLPLGDGQFDAAYSIASLKMWPSPEAGLAEMHRVLKPGGKIVVLELDRGATDAAVRNYSERFRWIPSGICAAYVHSYVVAQSPDVVDAEAIVRRSPFTKFEVTRMPDYPFFVIRAEKAGGQGDSRN